MTEFVQTVVQLPLALNLAIIFILSITLPALTVWLVRRKWPYPTFKENNELIGFTYAVYGLIYGVLLAFIIIIGWESFGRTEELVMQETTILSELWRDSEPFSPSVRDGIHQDLTAYTQSVIDNEWPSMANSGKADPQTQAIYEHLWTRAYNIQPANENQTAFQGEFLARMNDLSGTRRLRIEHSDIEIQSVLLLVLMIGGVCTVAYTLLFSNKHAWVQGVIMGNVMLIVLLGLLVVVSLQHPFTGDVSIKPDAFRDLLQSFQERASEPPPM